MLALKEVDPLLNQGEAAKLLKRSRVWLNKAMKSGVIPPECYKVMPNIMGTGKRQLVLYRADKLIELDLV